MTILFTRRFLVTSLIMAAMVNASADTNLSESPTRIQRSFVNLGFEQFTTNPPTPPESGWASKSPWAIYDQAQVIGWRSTAPKKSNTGAALNYRGIEIWNEKRSGGTTSKAKEGDYYAELNAHVASTLYQNICLLEDDEFSWSLWHMPRKATTETMQFQLSDMITDNGGSAEITPSNIQVVSTTIQSKTVGSWQEHKSSTDVKAKTYLGGLAAKVKAFGFRALAGGNEGNFIDNLKINLKPAVEFIAESGAAYENDASAYQPIRFKIVGLVEGDLTVSFVIDNTNIVNPATYGVDYALFERTAEGKYNPITITTSADGKQIKFDYKVKYNTSLDYLRGVAVENLVVKLIDNDLIEGDKTIPFALDKVQQGKVKVMGTEGCGNAPLSSFQYEVKDNDTDLSVTKTLNEASPLPNDRVSYSITLDNLGRSTAQKVVLKDTLLSNLIKDTSTTLTCESINVDGAVATCPIIVPETSLNNLLSKDGLEIGSFIKGGRLKFTLSGLRVSETDTATGDHLGYIKNQAEITTQSNDINLKNNIAVAQNIYPTKNDLMNADSSKSGTGLFVIDKDGKALWTKAAEKDKVYFPLNIKNEAKLLQTYQLYASQTAIAKEVENTSGLSALNKNSISSYTEKLKIEFVDVTEDKCNANLGGARQITQIDVNANAEKQICAVITLLPSASSAHDIWFAIESIQTGLGDVIRDSVTSTHLSQRLLELLNDQKAQVNVGGTFVFLHRLLNKGSIDEKNITFNLLPLKDDGFLYSLFIDSNGNNELDAQDLPVLSSSQNFELTKNQTLQLLLKVQAPSTASNGMMSQVQLVAIPDNTNQPILLESLINTDTIFVGSNQVQVTKMQYKKAACSAMTNDEVKAVTYTISSQTIGKNDCLIYRITVKNLGKDKLSNIALNDMYPAYTNPWKSGNILPFTSSADAVSDDGSKITTTLKELLPQQEKHLYFGIRLQ